MSAVATDTCWLDDVRALERDDWLAWHRLVFALEELRVPACYRPLIDNQDAFYAHLDSLPAGTTMIVGHRNPEFTRNSLSIQRHVELDPVEVEGRDGKIRLGIDGEWVKDADGRWAWGGGHRVDPRAACFHRGAVRFLRALHGCDPDPAERRRLTFDQDGDTIPGELSLEQLDAILVAGAAIDREIDRRLAELELAHPNSEDARGLGWRLPFFAERRRILLEMLSEIRPVGGARFQPGRYSNKSLVEVVQFAATMLPDAWVEASNERWPLVCTWTKGQGSYEDFAPGERETHSKLRVHPSNSRVPGDPAGLDCALHELMHRFEDSYPRIAAAEWTFFQLRVRGGSLESEICEFGPRFVRGRRRRSQQVARGGVFKKAYMGRTYGMRADSSYEVLTMAMSDLMTGDEDVLFDDDELRRFTLGCLALL